jgi:hypothetical protein
MINISLLKKKKKNEKNQGFNSCLFALIAQILCVFYISSDQEEEEKKVYII